ncbi:MAG: 2-oxoacid:ferredoxin oxidoreductase subunit gamma [Firmicutes bacterium]|jgi:2-oxoglutarate ferredoxin oxidoreductase subunit gamma|nr:2-oxoacid:ferredoxin oxidoreductase subunit gamma [Bacillota bacterium]
MTHDIIIAGFGGQGVMLLGQLITESGLRENKKVTWLPSYGPEMRGGTANCSVVVSEKDIGTPIVINPTAAIVMNIQSFEKFAPMVKPGGVLFINSSLIDQECERTDITQYRIPANDLAEKIGNNRVANMIMLGAFLKETKAVGFETIVQALKDTLPPHRQNLMPLNEEALKTGADLV